MPYRAGSGGGMFGSSVYPDSRPKVDVAGGIDAITDGASTMIRAAYQRRLAENALQVQADERAYQHGRDQRADQQHDEDTAYRRSRDEAQDREKALGDRRSAIERGFTPEHTETALQSMTAPAPAAPSAVRRAMAPAATMSTTDPTQPGALPAAGMAAVSPTPAPIPTNTPTPVTVPETYDPEKSGKFALEKERAVATANENSVRAARQVALKQLGGQLAESLAKLRASLKTSSGGSNVSRAMTGNKLEDARKNAAIGLIGHTNGSYDEAVAYLNSPDGASLRAEGVKPEHLMYAHSQYTSTATNQAIRLQTAGLGATAQESATQVKKTRELVGGKSPATTTDTPAPAAPAAARTPSTPAAKPPVAAAAKPAKAPLSAEVKARAVSDPKFANFLKEKGYTAADWGAK